MKYLIGFAFVGILGALAMAGVFMLRDGRDGKTKGGNMMRALAVRVGLSVLLFACVLFAAGGPGGSIRRAFRWASDRPKNKRRVQRRFVLLAGF